MEDFKEYFRGFFVGCSQTIVGHPFDTAKTRIQAGRPVDMYKLYRGVSFPLFTSCLTNSVMFGSYSRFREAHNDFVSGFLAGIVIAPIMTPIEKSKIDFQVSPKMTLRDIRYTSLFRGFQATLLRESFSTGIYFSSYHSCKDAEYFTGSTNVLFSGGIAGMMSWLFTYPVDVIKTRIQSGEGVTFSQAYHGGMLYRGLGICLARSFIVNSLGFFIYEKIDI